jgi:hypothetical protein
MGCTWKEEQAYRFADGSMEPEAARVFEAHAGECATCHQLVEEAEELEVILRGAIAPVAAPATLAGRIALAVEAERGRPRFPWSWLPGRLALSPALATLLAVLALGLITVVAAPGAVMAVVQRALLFIPGLGISAVDEGHLVATGPVSAEVGGMRFTVEGLLSDGEWTTVTFNVTGLPGGKEGWDRPVRVGEGEPPVPAQPQAPGRPPYLQDETGARYSVRWATHGVGGSPQENRIEGQMVFAPLPDGLRSVDLVVPVDYLAPAGVVPGGGTQEWVLGIPVAPAAQSGLPGAIPQGASATDNGVALRVVATTAGPDGVVVLLEGDAAGQEQVSWLGSNGGNLAEEVRLTDDRGRSYELRMPGSRGRVGDVAYSEDLYFEPVAGGARELTLSVSVVRVGAEGSARVTIGLAGRAQGESFELNREVRLGEHAVLLKSARVEGSWLFVEVDLGPKVDGRMLSAFSLEGTRSWSSAIGASGGHQMSHFGVALEPGQDRVELELARPLLNVEGEWKMTFPVAPK